MMDFVFYMIAGGIVVAILLIALEAVQRSMEGDND